jgi:outer membrane protein
VPLWEAGAGVTYLSIPEYRGSGKQQEYIFPVPYFVYRGDFLKVDRYGVKGVFYETPNLELTLSLSASPPVTSESGSIREDMPDLDPTFELGPMVRWFFTRSDKTRFSLRIPVRTVQTLNFQDMNHVGFVTTPALVLDTSGYPVHNWNSSLSIGLSWSDSDYNSYYYDVENQFSTPVRPAYDVGGGFGGSWIRGTLSRRFDKTWVGCFALYEDLSSAVFADSPLVEEDRSVMFGIAFSWILSRSKTSVQVP